MRHSELLKQAKAAANDFKRCEAALIEVLGKVDAVKAFRELGYPSLFSYAVEELALSEGQAYGFITVSRKAREVPELRIAIAQGEITVAKAKAIVSVLNKETQAHWLAQAKNVSTRDLEELVAMEKPELVHRERVRMVAMNSAQLEMIIPEALLAKFKRAQEIAAVKRGKTMSYMETFEALADEYLERHDPLRKAERAEKRTLHVESSRAKEKRSLARIPMSIQHEVVRRDRERCQYRMANGKRCGSRQWLHLHHIVHRSKGGKDTVDNLMTVCSGHHRAIHEGSEIPKLLSRVETQGIGDDGAFYASVP